MKGAWLIDQGAVDITSAFRVIRRVHEERTAYQHLEVYESARFGRMLVLDGAVQTTEADEFTYHEMLAHPALCTHPAPRRVLLIGGGDGGLLEEVLKHPVERATIVEIDEAVIQASRRHLPSVSGGAFDDPRTHLVVADGIAYVREATGRYDVVLVDSTDPEGPAVGLFEADFYRAIARRLGPGGVLAVQSGSAVYQQDLTAAVGRRLAAAFPIVRPYLGAVPTYPGVLWSFTLASLSRDPVALAAEEIGRRIEGLGLKYYTARGHAAAFDLPPYLKAQLEAT